MVQLANVSRVGITDPLWTFEAPLVAPKGPALGESSCFEVLNSTMLGLLAYEKFIVWPKVTRFGPECSVMVVTTGTIQFGPDTWIFGFQKGFTCSCNGLLGAPRGGPKGPKMGQWCLNWKHWPIGPLCVVWNPIWCRTRHPEGQKLICWGQTDLRLTTFDHPVDPPKSSQTPLNPINDLPYNQYLPSSYHKTE